MSNHGFGRIVLATDGSDQAAAALRVTCSFAAASSAAVRIVHVWNLEVHERNGVWDIEMMREAEKLLNEGVERLRSQGVEAEGTIVQADMHHIAGAIADAARDFKADLVVTGSRGLSDWSSMVHHSTSHQLLSSVDCPLLIVRAASEPVTNRAQRVLLAVAGGDDVAPGARAAAAAASATGSEVLVLHVAQAMVGLQGFAYVEPDDEIKATIEQTVDILKQSGITAASLVAQPGHVADVVAKVAGEWRADVIVIGSSRMGDLGSLLLGSVTHDLLRATSRPVLVAERSRG